MKKFLIITFLILCFAVANASASLVVNVNTPNTMKIMWAIDTYKVPEDQAVAIKFKVTNVGSYQASFDRVRVVIKDPNGKVELDKFYYLGKQTLAPGESKEYEVKTTLVVDKVGTWTATVQIYNGNQKLCEDTKTFEVVPPQVETQITAINAIAVAGLASAVAGAGYLLGKRKIGV